MNGSTQVRSELLRSAADNMESKIRQYNTLVTELFNFGNELDGTWDGDANEKFDTQMKADRPKFQALHNGIMTYVKFLRDQAAEYERAENAAVNAVTANTIRKK